MPPPLSPHHHKGSRNRQEWKLHSKQKWTESHDGLFNASQRTEQRSRAMCAMCYRRTKRKQMENKSLIPAVQPKEPVLRRESRCQDILFIHRELPPRKNWQRIPKVLCKMGPPLRRYNQTLVRWIKLGLKEYIPITDGWIPDF